MKSEEAGRTTVTSVRGSAEEDPHVVSSRGRTLTPNVFPNVQYCIKTYCSLNGCHGCSITDVQRQWYGDGVVERGQREEP